MFPLMLHFLMKSHAVNQTYVLPHLSRNQILNNEPAVILGRNNLLPVSFGGFFLFLVFRDLCDFVSALSHSESV